MGPAHELLITTILIGARLWLPLSLIEIGFRNEVDAALREADERGGDWLFAQGSVSGESFSATAIRGHPLLCVKEDGVVVDDPVSTAALVSKRGTDSDIVSRDDVIAHLMLGFWVVRVPEGFCLSEERRDVFDLVARRLNSQLGDAEALHKLMSGLILNSRNRVAHHEPVVIRAKHVYAKQGNLKAGADLVTSLESGLARFDRDAERIIATARIIAPMASSALAQVTAQIQSDLQPFRATLLQRADELRKETAARRAARRSGDATLHQQ